MCAYSSGDRALVSGTKCIGSNPIRRVKRKIEYPQHVGTLGVIILGGVFSCEEIWIANELHTP